MYFQTWQDEKSDTVKLYRCQRVISIKHISNSKGSAQCKPTLILEFTGFNWSLHLSVIKLQHITFSLMHLIHNSFNLQLLIPQLNKVFKSKLRKPIVFELWLQAYWSLCCDLWWFTTQWKPLGHAVSASALTQRHRLKSLFALPQMQVVLPGLGAYEHVYCCDLLSYWVLVEPVHQRINLQP